MNLPPERRSIAVLCLLVFLASFLGGCVTLQDPEVSQDITPDLIGSVDPLTSVGQTILIRRHNFNGITFWVSVDIDNPDTSSVEDQLLHIDIFDHSEYLSNIYIHRTTVSLEPTTEKKSVNISFPPLNNSANKTYLVSLSTDYGSISIYGSKDDKYNNGQAFINLQPIESDIGFSTSYDYDPLILYKDIKNALQYIWITLPVVLVLLLPGFLLLIIFGVRSSYDIGQIIGISIGLSLAFTPLLILWISTIGLVWDKSLVLFLNGFLTSVLLILTARKYIFNNQFIGVRQRSSSSNISRTDVEPFFSINRVHRIKIGLILVGVFLLTLAVRMIMIRDLAAPPWVDSVHHALITRIIIETGTLPETYLPYLDIEPTFYHPGFHSSLATFELLSGLDTQFGMLIFGQVINAMMIFLVYSLTEEMTKNRGAGIIAALITGLFTPMPAYYTSWGRYTQLAGLIILPTAYMLFKASILKTDGKLVNSKMILTSIAFGGLFLVHYRVTAFLALLIASEILIGFIYNKLPIKSYRINAIKILIIVSLSAILVLPWLIPAIPNTFLVSLKQAIPGEASWFQDFSWRYLNAASGKQVLALAGIGLIWGVIQKKRFAFVLLVWIVFLLLLANMSVLGLPGGGFINTTSVEISFFIPISILAGYLIVEIIRVWRLILPKKIQPAFTIAIGLLTVFLSYVGARNIIPILNPVTFLARDADKTAITWLKKNVAEGEKILINPFLWGYGLYAGNDGGYWITPLIGMNTIPPPALYGLAPDEQVTLINQISQKAIDYGSDPEGLHSVLTEHGVNYIYIGVRGGPISSEALNSSQGFARVYNDQGVKIYEVLP